MRLVPNLAAEFEEVCAQYDVSPDPLAKDVITLVKMFGDQNDDNDSLKSAWLEFLEEHKHQVTITMVGMILYLLITYWEKGQVLGVNLPTLERILVRDTVQQISDEIDRKSAANGNSQDDAQRPTLA